MTRLSYIVPSTTLLHRFSPACLKQVTLLSHLLDISWNSAGDMVSWLLYMNSSSFGIVLYFFTVSSAPQQSTCPIGLTAFGYLVHAQHWSSAKTRDLKPMVAHSSSMRRNLTIGANNTRSSKGTCDGLASSDMVMMYFLSCWLLNYLLHTQTLST